jgi:transglutaminase-like putative cysteine protease
MRLKATCDMRLTADEACPTIGMLRPSSGTAQWLASEAYYFDPHVSSTEYVDGFGNSCLRFVIPKGTMRIHIDLVVDTEDQIAVDFEAPMTPVEDLPDAALQFLLQSRYCPSDKMVGRTLRVVGDALPGYAQVEAIRAWIHGHLANGAGVCRDFSHVGIAMCRSLSIPARMVVGYLHQLDPMDLHAWFEAFVGGRWYTFDATQDEPRGGRIVVAYGRDAADVAFLSNYGPLRTERLTVSVELHTSTMPPSLDDD